MPQQTSPLLRHGIAAGWLACFLFLAFHGGTLAPPDNRAWLALALIGAGYVLCFGLEDARRLWHENRALIATALLLAAAIGISEITARIRATAPAHAWPPQIGLLLNLPLLAVFLADRRRLTFTVGVFALFCIYHFVAMPVEAITGAKLAWHPAMPLPRDAGPLHFQASGLAQQAYFFPGLFLPLFYLAWGPVYEKRVFPDLALPRRAMLALALLWLIPAACVQSRSAFAGALCAALLAIIATSGKRSRRAWFAAALLVVVAAAIYWLMFAQNKSGVDLRLAYFELYVREALQWPWALTGHSAYLDPDMTLRVSGMQPLQHSHNDFAQILYTWGLPGAAAYIAFWAALLRLVWTRFVAHREVWPACALVVLIPSMVTDLGFHHYEKAVMLVLLAALCMALPAKTPAAATPAA